MPKGTSFSGHSCLKAQSEPLAAHRADLVPQEREATAGTVVPPRGQVFGCWSMPREAALAELRRLRAERAAAGRAEQDLLAHGDGSCDVVDLWATLLARTARNRALCTLPPSGAHRNRRHGERATRPEAWLRQRDGWQRTTVRVWGRDLPLR